MNGVERRPARRTLADVAVCRSRDMAIAEMVAEIWPFEIIQDGGLPPSWI